MIVYISGESHSIFPTEMVSDERGRNYVDMHTMEALIDLLRQQGRGGMLEIVESKKNGIPMIRIYGGANAIAQAQFAAEPIEEFRDDTEGEGPPDSYDPDDDPPTPTQAPTLNQGFSQWR